ncbi:MAG TPA: hypothetical protein VGM44_25200 [Polyangiaceae bacterium]
MEELFAERLNALFIGLARIAFLDGVLIDGALERGAPAAIARALHEEIESYRALVGNSFPRVDAAALETKQYWRQHRIGEQFRLALFHVVRALDCRSDEAAEIFGTAQLPQRLVNALRDDEIELYREYFESPTMSRKVYQTSPSEIVSGNANGLPAGSVIVGPTLGTIPARTKTISAAVSFVLSTGGLSFTPSWQVGNKADMSDAQLIETGEIGSPHAIEATGARVIPAPHAVSGFMFCRLVLTTAGATGATADTYRIVNHWAEPDAADIVSGTP